MKQILVQLDDQIAAQLDAVVPGKSRKRSEFVRRAIARALLEVMELRTRAAYERMPQEAGGFDPETWAPEHEAIHPPAPRKSRGRRR